MRSQKIRPHHKSHARLATALATCPATGDVQAMSSHNMYKSLHGCAPDTVTDLSNPVARSEARRRL